MPIRKGTLRYLHFKKIINLGSGGPISCVLCEQKNHRLAPRAARSACATRRRRFDRAAEPTSSKSDSSSRPRSFWNLRVAASFYLGAVCIRARGAAGVAFAAPLMTLVALVAVLGCLPPVAAPAAAEGAAAAGAAAGATTVSTAAAVAGTARTAAVCV